MSVIQQLSLALLSLFLFGLMLPPRVVIKLEVGAKLDRKYIPKKITREIMTHPGQTRPFIEPSLDGIKYMIAFDEKTRVIKYIYTNDKNFRTVNGLRVSSEIPLTRAQIEIIP